MNDNLLKHSAYFFVFLQLNDSLINKRLEMDGGTEYRWIVPVDYVTNLVDYRDSFILNKTSSKSTLPRGNSNSLLLKALIHCCLELERL